MNKILTLVLFGFCLQSFGQVVDDFSDGDFTANPAWQSDNLTLWTVVNGQLRSNSTVASSSFFIAIPSNKALLAQWEFWVNLTFNTSGANFVDVYLTSDQANPASAGNNGYFVRIGGTPDEVSLYKLTNGVSSILINGVDGITNSSNNSLRIKVIHNANNVWSLERDVSGSGNNYVLEGTSSDNTFTTSTFFAIRVTQSTSTFHQKHFFDNFYIGNIIVESTPPAIQSVEVTAAHELTLTFSEALESNSSQVLSNYTVNNTIGSPISAILQPDQKIVKLTFATGFINGVEYQLNIAGVKDLVGNVIVPVSQPFRYFVAHPASAFDLVINELLPDPNPQIGLPAAEFIEIYNRSNKPFDLQQWKLSDPTSTAILPTFFLLPGEWVILTSSSSAPVFTNYGKVIGLTNFPTLNNSGDALTLRDATGLKIDSVNYSINWFDDADKEQGGWTLERLNPSINSNEPTNWLSSIDASGGTPGKQNSVFGKNPDSKPPVLESIQVITQQELRLVFNEALGSNSVVTDRYFVSDSFGSPGVVTLSSDQKMLTLQFTKRFVNGVDYTLTLNGVTDVAGNVMPLAERPFRFFVPLPVKPKDIIFSEIMADPSPVVQLPEAEYLELYNRSDGPLDVGGWKLTDASAQTTLPSKIILPKTYLILTSTTNVNKYTGAVLGVSSFPSLNNSGEALSLRAGAVLIDSVNYSLSWYQDKEKEDGGWTLELIDPENICGEEDNWVVSENPSGGTPGLPNSVLANKPDLTGPRLLSVMLTDEQHIKLSFNEKLNSSLAGVAIRLTPEIDILSVSFVDRSLRELLVTTTKPFLARTLYTVAVNNLRDCAGNEIDKNYNQQEFALTEIAEANDVVINEILFNPRSGGVDFIEIYNRSDKFINLKNWLIGNEATDPSQEWLMITSSDVILRPNTLLVFSSDPSVLAGQYPTGDASRFLKTRLPSLPDDAGSITVISPTGVIDSFTYSEDYHHALLKDPEGVSLERIAADKASHDASNWQSATAQAGYATPGLMNSNSRPTVEVDENNVVVEPEIFSPFTGFSKINYRFDQTGMIASVRILDASGRLIKEVANNETIGYEGSFRWDGDQQDGSKARMGYYTIWMEVFSLEGMVKRYRKRVVISSN